MLTRIDFNIVDGATQLSMDVAVPKSTTKFLVTKVTGLDPVKADVSMTSLSGVNSDSLQSTRVGRRNVVIEFEYTPNFASNQTPEALRQELYSIAGTGRTIELSFVLDNTYRRNLVGVVESLVSDMFSRTLKGQISVLCPNPYFKGTAGSANGTTGSILQVTYDGDVPGGVELEYKVPTAPKTVNFQRSARPNNDGWGGLIFTLPASSTLPANNDLLVGTYDRNKFAKTFSGFNLIPYLTTFNWWKLYPGLNIVSLTVEGFNGTTPTTAFNVSWDNFYGGL